MTSVRGAREIVSVVPACPPNRRARARSVEDLRELTGLGGGGFSMGRIACAVVRRAPPAAISNHDERSAVLRVPRDPTHVTLTRPRYAGAVGRARDDRSEVVVTTLEALLLGTIQGVFMFVPVSSTSHLVLVQHALIGAGSSLPPPESASMLLFDLVVHVGTLVSIAVVFYAGLARLGRGAWDDLRGRGRGDRLFLRLVLLGLLSVGVTGLVGVPLKRIFEQAFAAPPVIALTLALTGVLLLTSDRLDRRWRGLRDITVTVALVIGIAQAFALLPGLSRSGLTIVAALLMGVQRRWAGEYSFFLAIPTILAASALQAVEVWRAPEPLLIGMWPLFVGFVVAAVVGIGSLLVVVRTLLRARFRVFAYYVWALAVVVLVVSLLTPQDTVPVAAVAWPHALG